MRLVQNARRQEDHEDAPFDGALFRLRARAGLRPAPARPGSPEPAARTMSEAGTASPAIVPMPAATEATPARVRFGAERAPFLGMLLGGLILMIPTLGLYRFWLVTRKRRFYWAHTELDGDALEYTGTPAQLLVGFLLAVLIFLPIYAALFYVTVRLPDFSALTYLVLVPLFYFLMGYAAFRSRRFRLSRTLWRGIRFQQTGNAWVYALKRFWWTFLTILTLGLTYPVMARSLWAYRINNTWLGDRRFTFTGKVSTIAWPFYGAYLVLVALIVALVFQVASVGGDPEVLAVLATVPAVFVLAISYVLYLFVITRIDSRFFSSVRLGETGFRVRISATSIALQQLTYTVLLAVFAAVFGLVAVILVGGLTAGIDAIGGGAGPDDLARLMHMGSWAFFVLIGVYLVFLGLWGVLSELVLAFGYWKIVARGTRVENLDRLGTIRAAGVESTLAGEGLADALNVGAY